MLEAQRMEESLCCLDYLLRFEILVFERLRNIDSIVTLRHSHEPEETRPVLTPHVSHQICGNRFARGHIGSKAIDELRSHMAMQGLVEWSYLFPQALVFFSECGRCHIVLRAQDRARILEAIVARATVQQFNRLAVTIPNTDAIVMPFAPCSQTVARTPSRVFEDVI